MTGGLRVAITGGAGFLGASPGPGDARPRRARRAGRAGRPTSRRSASSTGCRRRTGSAADPRVEAIVGDLTDALAAERCATSTSSCTSRPRCPASPSATSTSEWRTTSTRRARCSTPAAGSERRRSSCSPARSPCSAPCRVTRCRTWSSTRRCRCRGQLRHAEGDGRVAAVGLHPARDVRGRTVRLMTVTVRPGRPNAAASGFVSGIIREPLTGERSTCPVAPDTELAVSSPRTVHRGVAARVRPRPTRRGARRRREPPGAHGDAARDGRGDGPGRRATRRASSSTGRSTRPSSTSSPRGRPGSGPTAPTALGLAAEPDFDTIVRGYLDER